MRGQRIAAPRGIDGARDKRSSRAIENAGEAGSMQLGGLDLESQPGDGIARLAGEAEAQFPAIHRRDPGHRTQGRHAVVAAGSASWRTILR